MAFCFCCFTGYLDCMLSLFLTLVVTACIPGFPVYVTFQSCLRPVSDLQCFGRRQTVGLENKQVVTYTVCCDCLTLLRGMRTVFIYSASELPEQQVGFSGKRITTVYRILLYFLNLFFFDQTRRNTRHGVLWLLRTVHTRGRSTRHVVLWLLTLICWRLFLWRLCWRG